MLNSDSLKFCPPLPWIAAPGCLLVHFVNVWWPGRAPLSLCLPLPTWIFAIWGQFIFCPEEIVDLCYNVKKLKIKAVIVMMMMLMMIYILWWSVCLSVTKNDHFLYRSVCQPWKWRNVVSWFFLVFGWFPCFFQGGFMVFHGFWLVSMFFQGGCMVFQGF